MFEVKIGGIGLKYETAPDLFSPRGLDAGTAAMLSCVEFSPNDKVLDLGCGYGVVGIYAAKLIGEDQVTMADIDPGAVALAAGNAARNGVPGLRVLQSDGFEAIDDAGYSLILTNPPYHVDFSVPKRFIEGARRHLAPGGRLVMVTRRREWYKRKLITVFGGVRIQEAGGYFVFSAEKRARTHVGEK